MSHSNVKDQGQSVRKIRMETEEQTDGWTDRADCITAHATAVDKNFFGEASLCPSPAAAGATASQRYATAPYCCCQHCPVTQNPAVIECSYLQGSTSCELSFLLTTMHMHENDYRAE